MQVVDDSIYAHFKHMRQYYKLWNRTFMRKSRKAWMRAENNFRKENKEGIG